MDIPSYIPMKIVDEKGFLTAEWANIFNQIISQLQINFGNEGLKPPGLTTDQINELVLIAAEGAAQAEVSNSNIFFDTTTNNSTSMKTIINGTLYTFTLT